MSTVLREANLSPDYLLQIARGDITEEQVDAIVNAANLRLQHGGGVAGAIVRKGGHVIQEQSDAWVRTHGPVSHGDPAHTGAGNLPCRYVIHAVGPVWGEGDEEAKLTAAIQGSLRLAGQLNLHSIALPAISTGIYGFPKPRAAQVILKALQDCAGKASVGSLELVRITLFDEETVQAFLEAWEKIIPRVKGS